MRCDARRIWAHWALCCCHFLATGASAQDATGPDEKADASIERAIEETPDVTAQDDAELTPEGGKKVEFETVPYVPEKAPDTSTIIPRVPGVDVPELDGTPGAAMSGVAQNNSLADQRLRAGVAQPVLNLTDTIQMVLQNNPQRAAARAQLEAALANVGIAKAAGGLQIDLDGSLNTQRGFFGTGSNFSGGTGTGTGTGTGGTGTGGTGTGGTGTGGTVDPTIPTNFVTNTGNFSQSLSVGAILPIYSGGRVKASKRAAQASARAQAALTLQTEQDLVSNATAAYLTILRRGAIIDSRRKRFGGVAGTASRGRSALCRRRGTALGCPPRRCDFSCGPAAARAGGQRCSNGQKSTQYPDGTFAGNAV